jgi:ABC-type multidrug transport system ATPase subunit
MNLIAQQVSKSFETFTLKPFSFTFPEGQCTAVLGANGAGKSTLFDLLVGQSDASSGSVSLGGERLTPESFQLKRQIGFLPQTPRLPAWVCAAELLHYAAKLYGLPSDLVSSQAERWDCQGFLHKPLTTCSLGMQKRVGLALSTLHNPQLLVLDEPFAGLDIYHLRTLEQMIIDRIAQRKTTILSSHVISFVVKLADSALIIKEGSVFPLANWSASQAREREQLIEAEFFPR